MLLCQTSCSDFFDQMPTDRLTYNDLFESKASTEKALATVYVYLPDEFAQRYQQMEDILLPAYGLLDAMRPNTIGTLYLLI